MLKSELRKIIREEYSKLLKEDLDGIRALKNNKTLSDYIKLLYSLQTQCENEIKRTSNSGDQGNSSSNHKAKKLLVKIEDAISSYVKLKMELEYY